MSKQIRIKNNNESVTIDIEGTIGVPEQWQFENPDHRVATYEGFRRSIGEIEQINASKVVVNIRSTGGDVGDALLIYEALAGLDAEVTTRCWGYVASAATIIAQAASEGLREISPNALYLIHNSTCTAEGNAVELAQRVELLKKSDERLAELYARRSGRDAEYFVSLMGEESGEGRWLSAAEVLEAGLADRVIDTEEGEEGEAVGIGEVLEETIQDALDSVKGLIKRIGAKFASSDEVTPKAVEVGVSDATPIQSSTIEFEQRQMELQPTTLESCEDPSLREAMVSANDSAYSRDARRISRF